MPEWIINDEAERPIRVFMDPELKTTLLQGHTVILTGAERERMANATQRWAIRLGKKFRRYSPRNTPSITIWLER